MTDTAAKPASSKPQTGQTVYVVLRKDGPGWLEDGPHQTARTPRQAIQQTIDLRNESQVKPDGIYAAIPARSWRPVTVTVETKTTIRLS